MTLKAHPNSIKALLKYSKSREKGYTNAGSFKKGHLPLLVQDGEKNSNWKGDNVGYSGLHRWLRKKLGNPKECQNCKREGKKNNGRWNLEWANKSHKYKRDLADWIGLCRFCHIAYDKGRLKV